LLRCSLRSKDDIDVARVAHTYNGGGHKTAAGFKCREPLEVIKKKLLNQLQQMYFPVDEK
jgi:phosphoesterase RecJ-like protein